MAQHCMIYARRRAPADFFQRLHHPLFSAPLMKALILRLTERTPRAVFTGWHGICLIRGKEIFDVGNLC